MTPQRKPGKAGRVPGEWDRLVLARETAITNTDDSVMGRFTVGSGANVVKRGLVLQERAAMLDCIRFLQGELNSSPTSAGERRGADLERAVVKAAMNEWAWRSPGEKPDRFIEELRTVVASHNCVPIARACARLELHRRSQRGRKKGR